MEKIYSIAAINLFKNDNPNFTSVLSDIKELYLDDESFENYFYLKQFNTSNSSEKKLLRYTLSKLEGQTVNGHIYDFESDSGTIEHILPESYPEDWNSFFSEEEFERNIYMIGNLTLLERNKNNKKAGDKNFEDKKSIYSTSKYSLTNSIESADWTPQTIKHRQFYLAKLACGIWKI